jgi:hypothetical protein
MSVDKFSTCAQVTTWRERMDLRAKARKINLEIVEEMRLLGLGNKKNKHLSDIAFVNQNARGK